MTRRDDSARMGGERPALGVDQTDPGMGEHATIDRDRSADLDMRARQGRDRLDERSRAARTEAGAQVAALEPQCLSGPLRHTYKDEVADLDRPVEPLDAPQSERIARGRVQAEAADPAKACERGERGRAKSQH